MNIVITGASGYIGSVLCKYSTALGHNVLGIDINRPNHIYYNKFVFDNIKSFDAARATYDFKPDVIFHLAASADVTDSVRMPVTYFDNNIGATSSYLNNLMFSFNLTVPIIFSSTAAVYGNRLALAEEHSTLSPINAYGQSKLMCETLLDYLYTCNNISSVSFRYFNVAGAFDNVGDHSTSSHVIQRLCDSEINNKDFYIFGNNYATYDGTCVRDFIHVIDVCRAHFTAYEYLLSNKGNHIFNLGTGFGTSVKDLSEMFKVSVKYKDRRPGDPDFLVARPVKFVDATGFKYNHSDLDTIVKSSLEWYRRSNANRRK
jgi:UDP-glucose-4-epimerase GalE